MATLTREVIDRVRTLPDEESENSLPLPYGTNERAGDEEYTLYVETDLTEEEKGWIRAGRREEEEDPEGMSDFADVVKELGITVNEERINRLKIVCR